MTRLPWLTGLSLGLLLQPDQTAGIPHAAPDNADTCAGIIPVREIPFPCCPETTVLT